MTSLQSCMTQRSAVFDETLSIRLPVLPTCSAYRRRRRRSCLYWQWSKFSKLQACYCKRDPLELQIWNSWQNEIDEWETEKFTEDELVDILFEEDGSAETAAQNILAITLSLLLLLATGSILWRIALVSWALISAAVRYSVVAVMLLILAVFFF